ncbi:MAG: hypothetical protein A3K75_05985 [Euryarchaeota archaeon RBG_13_61_15]|jgi:hypothetical protein|nr:MAG: hypothetical protein A3K75_05985 [Euryarchaeota archaeon RBG_13_61_15]
MPEKLTEHPILAYITFGLPLILLALAMVFNANVLMIIAILAWLGVAFLVLYLPMSSDNGSSG